MIRVFLIVVALGVLLLAGGMVYLGMFPPNPPQHAVEKTLPIDKVQTQTQ
ncbi:MAG TPA: hypothetical protein VME47_04875 [Acetobacteraceae bacterium]|nr:hypothetical protein [Acetobacteraceae bacterium]